MSPLSETRSEVQDGDRNPSRRSEMEPNSVQDRHDLMTFLSQSLISEYHVVHDDQVKQTSTFPKAYIVEVEEKSRSSGVPFWSKYFPVVEPTKDETLIRAYDSKGSAFFIDERDRRFCLIHSIAKTDSTDRVVRSLFDNSTDGFDRAWLPTQFLLNTHLGYLRGFKFAHQPLAQGILRSGSLQDVQIETPQVIPDEYFKPELEPMLDEEDSPIDLQLKLGPDSGIPVNDRIPVSKVRRSSLSVRDSATAAPDFAAILKEDVFESRRSLDWIQYRAFTDRSDEILHSVYANGKVTASGTSIGLHMHGLDQIRRSYSKDIRTIERDYSIGWVSTGSGSSLKGTPMIIRFSDALRINDLRLFARSIFRAARPFRLFGYPHSISDGRLDVEAVDLHTGDTFSVELTPEWMRIFLPIGSCGNVIARLLTNLQHAMNSETSLLGGDATVLLIGGIGGE